MYCENRLRNFSTNCHTAFESRDVKNVQLIPGEGVENYIVSNDRIRCGVKSVFRCISFAPKLKHVENQSSDN